MCLGGLERLWALQSGRRLVAEQRPWRPPPPLAKQEQEMIAAANEVRNHLFHPSFFQANRWSCLDKFVYKGLSVLIDDIFFAGDQKKREFLLSKHPLRCVVARICGPGTYSFLFQQKNNLLFLQHAMQLFRVFYIKKV